MRDFNDTLYMWLMIVEELGVAQATVLSLILVSLWPNIGAHNMFRNTFGRLLDPTNAGKTLLNTGSEGIEEVIGFSHF